MKEHMKEKIMWLKDKIMSNKLIAVGILLVLILAAAGISYAVIRNGDDKETASSSNATSGNLSVNNSGKKGDDDTTDGKSDSDKKETESKETTSEGETTKEGQTTKSGETASNGSGNSSNVNGGSIGSSTDGNTGNIGGSNSSGGQSSGGNSGCSANGSTQGNSGNSSTVIGTDTPQSNQNSIYNQLFDINNKITIKVDMSDAELQKLQSDYKRYGSNSSTYRKADKVTISIGSNTYVMYEVGVRLKGNTSVVEPLVNGNLNSRNLVNLKLSFKQTFDDSGLYGSDIKEWSSDAARKERKKRTFAGLESLELKWNRNLDSTYTCNYWANQMFRNMLGYGQNTTLCNVNVSSFNYGVYTLYEPVDENFIARYFPNDQGGDLYKCGWSSTGANYTNSSMNSIGVEKDNSSIKYTYDLKTNKKTSNFASLKNLITTLNSSSSVSTFNSVVDSSRWVKFAAVSYFAGNPDDMRNNYNNHYVYFLNNGKAVFIPYDYDRCFGIIKGMNRENGMVDANPASEAAKGLGGNQINPLYINSVIRKNNSNYGNNFSDDYKTQLGNVSASKWLNYDEFRKTYTTFKNNYSSVAIPDSNVRAYVYDLFDTSNRGEYNKSSLAFAESGNGNVAVSTYFSKIVEAYKKS